MSQTNVELFFDGDQFFSAALSAIRGATTSVVLESYIFQMDQIGLTFLDEMSHASDRGVRVYLLVDGLGSIQTLGPIELFCRQNGISCRIYHPLPFFDPRLRRRFWRFLSVATRFFRRMNYRNHRKVLVVDRAVAMVGSFNITQVHSRRISGAQAWRDTGALVRDPKISEVLQEAFLRAWRRARLFRRRRIPLPQAQKNILNLGSVRLNDRIRRRFHFARDVRRRIRQAKREILITNAYFLPRRSFLATLRKAARSGVFVGICLPEKNDVWIVRFASRTLYRRLLRSGVHIFEYQPSMLHAKTMIIDDWATIGSHNLNHRSFMHDLEVELAFDDRQVLEQMRKQWEKDIQLSRPVTLEELARDSIWRKMFSRLCFLFRYYL